MQGERLTCGLMYLPTARRHADRIAIARAAHAVKRRSAPQQQHAGQPTWAKKPSLPLGLAAQSTRQNFLIQAVPAELYSQRTRVSMLGRDEKQGYRVLLLVIDGEVRAGALFSLAQETVPGTHGAVLLDLLMLAVAEPYRFKKGMKKGRGYGSRVLDALQMILLRAAGVHPAYMLVRACSNARPFYEAKRGFAENPRATHYVKPKKTLKDIV